MAEILVTGGAGYIGSHTCVELLSTGHDVVVVDNLSNSSRASLQAVEKITGRSPIFYECDLRDRSGLQAVFRAHSFDAVMHFAGRKAVGESVAHPLDYYDHNVVGTLRLVECMQQSMPGDEPKTLVFSSSATVYGVPANPPIDESFPLAPINPYGRTKQIVEEVLTDLCASDPAWRVSLLRYFNPIGAHSSGEIGEDPLDIPNNLMPFISQVAVGKLAALRIFGDDYDTPDGTGIRDYIHVVDLAKGHLNALAYLNDHPGVSVFNLGTGQGHSVLEMLRAFEKAIGRSIPYEVVARRPGDAAISFADPSKANRLLRWTAELDVSDMCRDAWRWQQGHPTGYRSVPASRQG